MSQSKVTKLNPFKIQKRIFLALFVLCILGSLSVLPYILHLGVGLPGTSFMKFFLVSILQSTLLFGVICWISYLLMTKTDLSPFPLNPSLRGIIFGGFTAGLLVGLVLCFLDKTLFKDSFLSTVHPPAWTGVLATFYGGINEEVLMRLFLFTLIYCVLKKLFKIKSTRPIALLWATNLLVALLFGMGHLPAAFKLVSPSTYEVARILLLNGIPGIVFGWLYWSRGLWTAMSAHLVADLVLHVYVV